MIEARYILTVVHRCITNKKGDIMKEYMKKQIGHWIYKTMGTSSFIRRIEWRSMLEWLDPKEGERILDVACGAGALSLKIAEKGCEVHGVDISEDAIKYAKYLAEREKIACIFKIGNAENLPYPDGYVTTHLHNQPMEQMEPL